MKICLMGFGAVGQGVIKAISLKKDILNEKYGIDLKIVAVADSSGSVIAKNSKDYNNSNNRDANNNDCTGLNEELLLKVKSETGKVANYPKLGHMGLIEEDVLDNVDYDCLIEATPTNIETGEPAKSITIKAFNDKKDVVTSNKGHLALFYKEMLEEANKNNVQFKFEASVGGAMPIINLAEDTLASCEISSVLGILNGTTNYILSRMTSEGSSYINTLTESQQLGIAETDPAQDVEGIDAACKTVILANSILGIDATYSDVEITGISKINSGAIDLAKKQGYLIKLIAEVSSEHLKVSPRLVKINSPFAIDGTLNLATLKTDLAEDVTVVGKGAGPLETASAMITDIINIAKIKSN